LNNLATKALKEFTRFQREIFFCAYLRNFSVFCREIWLLCGNQSLDSDGLSFIYGSGKSKPTDLTQINT
jgi:hypothetical protein